MASFPDSELSQQLEPEAQQHSSAGETPAHKPVQRSLPRRPSPAWKARARRPLSHGSHQRRPMRPARAAPPPHCVPRAPPVSPPSSAAQPPYLADTEPHDLLLLGAQRVVEAHQKGVSLQVHRLHRHLAATLPSSPTTPEVGGDKLPSRPHSAAGPITAGLADPSNQSARQRCSLASGEARGASWRKRRVAHANGGPGVPRCSRYPGRGGRRNGEGRDGVVRPDPARGGASLRAGHWGLRAAGGRLRGQRGGWGKALLGAHGAGCHLARGCR